MPYRARYRFSARGRLWDKDDLVPDDLAEVVDEAHIEWFDGEQPTIIDLESAGDEPPDGTDPDLESDWYDGRTVTTTLASVDEASDDVEEWEARRAYALEVERGLDGPRKGVLKVLDPDFVDSDG